MIKPEKIIRSKRKTLSIQVNESGELIVRAPKSTSEKLIYDFIESHRRWILEKQKEVLTLKSKIKTYQFNEGEEFLFLGKRLKLRLIKNSSMHDLISPIVINENSIMLREEYLNNTKKVFQKFYMSEATKVLEDRVQFYIKKYFEKFYVKLNYNNIKISNSRRAIASCSAKGNLNFSWRIIQAPMEIIDYVVVHEIVHLEHKHHKKSFWLKVKMLKPDYKENIKWLKSNWFFLKEFLRDK